MSHILQSDWFARDTEAVARELLGKTLCRQLSDKGVVRLTINETEAYVGPHDSASHAHLNRFTKRTKTMFEVPGTLYIYLIYGMYWMLNIVTEQKDYPAAVLIRGASNDFLNLDGPGKLTRDLQIDKNLNNQILSKENNFWIEDSGMPVPEDKIISTPRIGINYASEPWLSAPLRFLLSE